MSTLKKITTLVLVLLLLVGAIAVSSLNADPVKLNLYWLTLNWPLGFTLLLCGTLGILAGLVIALVVWEIRNRRSGAKRVESEAAS